MRIGLVAIAMAGTSALATGAYAQAATGSSRALEPGNEGSGLGEIVVTAQRRAENIQKVPVAVTAISSAQLEQLRVVNVKDLAGVAPGLQVNSQGLASSPTIIIRGIASGVSNNSVDPKVGIYLDGVYIGRTVGSLFDLADIQRVEVLRGPQGTLFGRNATAGAISLVTAPPTGVFHVHGNLSYGNYEAKRGKISVDLPRFGPFFVKLAYLHDDIEGDYKNLIGGNALDFTASDPKFGRMTLAKRLGMRNIDGGQVAVRGEFGNLTADYRFDYTDQRTTGRSMQNLGRVPDGSDVILNPIDGFQGSDNLLSALGYTGTGGFTNISTSRLNAVANATSVEHVVTQGHSLTLTLQATDSLVIKSISAFRKFRQDPNIYDLAATGGLRFSAAQFYSLLGVVPGLTFTDIANPAFQPDPNNSFFSLLTARTTKQSQVSEELQFQLTRPAYSFTGGIFVFHEKTPATDLLGIFLPVDNGSVDVTTNGAFGGGIEKTLAVNNSFAAYGQLTVHLTDKLDVAGGIRGTIDDRKENIYSNFGANSGGLGVGNFNVTYRKATYTGIVTYHPTGKLNLYAKVASGYVAGGVFNSIAYKPESLTSYEAGIKSEMFDNKLRLNVAGYYQNYKDLQLENFSSGLAFFANAGKARITGVELEVEAAPILGLLLTANVSYNDFEYKKYLTTAYGGTELDIASVARTPYTSTFTGFFSAQYDAPAFANGSHLYGRLEGNYRTHFYLAAAPYTVSGNPLIGPDAPIEAADRIPGYWLVNGRLGLADVEIGGAKFTLSGFAQNLLNKHYISFGAPVEALTASYERGRTYGIELGFDLKQPLERR